MIWSYGMKYDVHREYQQCTYIYVHLFHYPLFDHYDVSEMFVYQDLILLVLTNPSPRPKSLYRHDVPLLVVNLFHINETYTITIKIYQFFKLFAAFTHIMILHSLKAIKSTFPMVNGNNAKWSSVKSLFLK